MRINRKYPVAVALGGMLALGTTGAIAQQASQAPKTHKCGGGITVSWGSGDERVEAGIGDVRATGLGCSRARGLAAHCMLGAVPEGWKASLRSRFVLTDGDRRVSWEPVGGGGCGLK